MKEDRDRSCSPWLLKERVVVHQRSLRDALGVQEPALGKESKVGKRNQAEQTPKVQVLNAASLGRLGSLVFLGQASARLED